MTEYLVELYVSRASCETIAVARARLTRAAAELTAEGLRVGLVRSIFVPEDETCFLLVEAESAETVREAARRAAVPCERIVAAAVDLPPAELDRSTSPMTHAPPRHGFDGQTPAVK